jgi:predicted TIM-barrel fold metal-dependent hydrolase
MTCLGDPFGPMTWDCHVHVFTDAARLAEPFAYAPAPAGPDALAAHLATHAIGRAVLVQPSPYGYDNSATLEALDRLGPQHRAVIAVPPGVHAPPQLAALRGRGVRGLRYNPLGRIARADAAARHTIALLGRSAADAGLALELNVAPRALPALADTLLAVPAPLVLAHFAGLLGASAGRAAREALLRLLDAGGTWVKASGLDRYPEAERDARLSAVAALLRRVARDRVLWGSDWPHTPLHAGEAAGAGAGRQPHREVDVAAARAAIAAAFGPDLWHAATVRNPQALYG